MSADPVRRMTEAERHNTQRMRVWLEKMDRLLGMGPAGGRQARGMVRKALGAVRMAQDVEAMAGRVE